MGLFFLFWDREGLSAWAYDANNYLLFIGHNNHCKVNILPPALKSYRFDMNSNLDHEKAYPFSAKSR